jgi:hypothetical protein
VLIIVGNDGRHALAVARLTRFSSAPFLGHEPGYWFLVTGDDDRLARLKLVDQLWQMRLSFFEGDG